MTSGVTVVDHARGRDRERRRAGWRGLRLDVALGASTSGQRRRQSPRHDDPRYTLEPQRQLHVHVQRAAHGDARRRRARRNDRLPPKATATPDCAAIECIATQDFSGSRPPPDARIGSQDALAAPPCRTPTAGPARVDARRRARDRLASRRPRVGKFLMRCRRPIPSVSRDVDHGARLAWWLHGRGVTLAIARTRSAGRSDRSRSACAGSRAIAAPSSATGSASTRGATASRPRRPARSSTSGSRSCACRGSTRRC